MKHYHGKIITVDKDDHVYQHLVEDKGKIIYVGNDLPSKYENAETIELGKRVLIPPFVDSHQHFASFATFHAGLNVMNARSNKEIIEMCKEYVSNCHDKLLIAFGASSWSVEENRLLSKEELDSVCPDRPFFMVKYDGHACVINSKLLNKVRKKVENLRGYHPDTGEMNQEAFFAVSNFITNSISIPKLIKNMKKAMDYEASKGIAMIHDVSGVGFLWNLDISMENYFAKHIKNHFMLRVFPQSMNVKVATIRHMNRIGGCFESALDGCFGSQDAALYEPYLTSTENNKVNNGVLYYSDEKVINWCKEANRKGLQIEMHAIGDRAFDQATRALKAALDDYPRDDARHGIIHDCLPTKEGVDICSKYHIHMPVQTAFINWPQEPDYYEEMILGKVRASRLNPIKDFFDNGIVVSAGSDAPCTDPDPILWIDKAINHTNPSQAISIQQALRMCTYNGYWTTFDEKEHGSLEVGKYADMVILSDDIYSLDKSEIKKVKVEQLLLHGKLYEKAAK